MRNNYFVTIMYHVCTTVKTQSIRYKINYEAR